MEKYAFSNATSKSMNQHKSRTFFISAIIAILMLGEQLLVAQSDNHITVPLTDPARPAQVRAHLLNGSITVKAYEGKEIIVDAKVRTSTRTEVGEGHGEGRGEGRGEGMHRIPMTSTGLNVEAENNQVRISTDSVQRTVDLTLSVPVHTSLSLRT